MSIEQLASTVAGLGDAPSWMTEDEARLAGVLLACGQAHVFGGWQNGSDHEKKHAFFAQARMILQR